MPQSDQPRRSKTARAVAPASPEPLPSMEALLAGGVSAPAEQQLLSLNPALRKNGLSLTRQDARDLLECRRRTLRDQSRIELEGGLLARLIRRLSESTCVTRENFVTVAAELYDIYHFVKNATSDVVGDDELVEALIACFEKPCGGSAELLAGKGAAMLIHNFRHGRPLAEFPLPHPEEDLADDFSDGRSKE